LYSFQSEQKSDAPKDSDAPAVAPAPQVNGALYSLFSILQELSVIAVLTHLHFEALGVIDKVDVKIYFPCAISGLSYFCSRYLPERIAFFSYAAS